MKRAMIVFTRVPVPGETKTRLMPFLDGEGCAALHSAFLKDIFRTCEEAGEDLFVFYTPKGKLPLLTGILGEDRNYIPQSGGDLGEKMEQAFREVFARGYESAILIGTDIPQIEASVLTEAFLQLETHDVVINPTTDGGYYLIGMKENYPGIWNIRAYGTGTVIEETLEHMRRLRLNVHCGKTYTDIDTKEDLMELYEEIVSGCIHCGRCTHTCAFLKKYEMDLFQFSEKPELAYHCFLCGKCEEVCPKLIDGRALALEMRRDHVDGQGGVLRDKAYAGLLKEKNPYLFANYRKGKTRSAIFMGCNFPSFFPKTEKRLRELMETAGIGVIYDCCGKPVDELGLSGDVEEHIRRMNGKLKEAGVEELVMVCPNCYYYLKDKLEVFVVTVYDKLSELGMGQVAEREEIPMYYPCPDRKEQDIIKGIRKFLKKKEINAFPKMQCCGLGGCAAAKESEIAVGMAKAAAENDYGCLYTYCASCVSNFKRKGYAETYHILSEILGVEEEVPLGVRPFLNRAVKKLI